MVSKKLLSAAIASAILSAPAFAAIDLVNGTGAVTYAKEAFLTTDDADTDGLYDVTSAANVLDITSAYGVGVSENNQIFIRVDLTNAQFGSALAAANAVPGGAHVAALAQGGAAGSSYAIFSVTATGSDIDQADTFTVDLTGETLEVSPTAAVTISVNSYETLTAAVNQTAGTSLSDDAYASAIAVANAVDATYTAVDQTAEVESEFTLFVDGNTTTDEVAVGKVDFTLAAYLDNDSTAVTLADVVTAATSEVTVSGDFSFGTWTYDAAADCSNAGTAVTINGDGDETTGLTVANFDNQYLCVEVDSTETINETAYGVDVDYEALATQAFPVADESGDFGAIDRNGTEIQIPYLTTFSEYNQRLVLVNRGSNAAAYTISFTTEAGTTATPGTKATGTLAAGKTTIIKATDIVSLTGTTRTAATVTIVAPEGDIDAATTIVNQADKGTDTVNLD